MTVFNINIHKTREKIKTAAKKSRRPGEKTTPPKRTTLMNNNLLSLGELRCTAGAFETVLLKLQKAKALVK